MFQLTIPEPCHTDWNEMMPTQQGAFCSSCSKEVVDFTQMSDADVKNYFLNKHTGSTCGRFRTEQIHRIRISLPETIFIQKMAGWKKFMAVMLLAFGSMLFGCEVDVNKHMPVKVEVETGSITILKGDTTTVDTTEMLGMIAMPTGASVVTEKDKKVCNVITGAVIAPPIMGDISLVPDTIIKPVTDTVADMRMGEIAMPQIQKKKPASDTGKCKDSGYY